MTPIRAKQTGAVSVIRYPEPGKVWIQHKDGHGGAFKAEDVMAAILRGEDLEEWFWKNF